MRLLVAIASVLSLTFCALAADVRADPSTQPGYVVIVNPASRVTSVERAFIEEAFLKKTTRWPNDEVIRPADLAPGSSARRRFSDEVLRRSVETIKAYWQQRIFSGRDVPPPEFERDEDAVRYVLKHEGGVAYVSPGTNLGGARAVNVR